MDAADEHDSIPRKRSLTACSKDRTRIPLVQAFLLVGVLVVLPAHAMRIEGYSAERHDRFASGYSADPVVNPIANNSPGFIGAAYDFSGVPWNSADRRQSFVFLSRKHYLFANHFGPGNNLQYYSEVTGLGSAIRASSVNLPECDIGIARLTSLLPASAGIATYPLLNLPTANSYVGRDLLMVGWFARLGKSKVSSVLPEGNFVSGSLEKYLFEYEGPLGRQDFVTLEGLDSGSPSFIPLGGELTLTGNHFYITASGAGGGGDSFLALPDVVPQINAVLAEDGFALKFRTEPAKQWTGLLGTSWGSFTNWTSLSVPTDTQALGFSGNVSNKTISLRSASTTRGMLFTGSQSQTGYTFQAGQSLTVGYVGIRNDAPATQSFNCSMVLNEHQHWTAANGNIQFAGTINLGAKFLNLGGPQIIFLNGTVSGSGGLSIQEGTTRLSASALYTGATYLYGGELHLLGTGQLPTAAPFVLAGGQLRVDSNNVSTGAIRLLDHSKLILMPGSGAIDFAPSVGEAWTPNSTLTVEGFNDSSNQLRIGDSFDDITPTQRAAISFVGVPAFHGGGGMLRPATPFQQWQLEKFPQEAGNPSTESTLWGDSANPSGDGTTNLLKYALNLKPLSSSANQLPQAEINPEGYLQISIPRNPDANDVTFLVEVSGELTTWQSGANHTVIVSNTPSLLVVRDATLFSEQGRRFMRLSVTRKLEP